MSAILAALAAPKASTGNNSHPGYKPTPDARALALVFVVEAVGATPTVTFKLQGTFDAEAVADGSANWFDLILLPSDSDTAAISKTVTATGAYTAYLAQAHSRFVRRVRVVTSANTNVTYRAEIHQQIHT